MDNSQKLVRPRTTGDSDLVERFARAMFEEWPLTAMSPAIAERSGLPEGTVLTYDKVLEMGGNHDGLLRLAKGAAKLHTAIEATLSTRAAEIERRDAALIRTATALHKMICCLGGKNMRAGGTHYRWASMLSVEDGQEAMAANNANVDLLEARQALSDTSGSAE